jgi:hypothetical protein
MLKKTQKYIVFILALVPFALYTQVQENNVQDSLLKQISDIEISLESPVEAEENLFMNTVSFQSFYDVLSPMGEWIQITKEDIDEDLNEGEGQSFSSIADDELLFIWKPSVNSDWKPFMNGRWEYTDHGWLWVSADKWGGTTYNYGRWWNSPKYGWVWLPGYTWAPGWVRWKITDDHIGWAPLSPKAKWKSETGITANNYKYNNSDNDWVFVNDNTFTGDINSSNIVSATGNSALVKTSSDITNIKIEDDKIINPGPDVNAIEKRTGKKFTRRTLKFSRERNRTIVGNDDIVIGRENLKKYSLDKDTKKPKITDKPGKFKKSDRVKKILKKRNQHKNHPKRKIPKR